LSYLSFQDPDKIAEGLALIWTDNHKWVKIAETMGLGHNETRTKLKLIVGRRNAIVHESDIDPVTNTKTAIIAAECEDITRFLQLCGQAIAGLVIY